MTRYKCVSSKKTIAREDLAELVDCMRRIQRIEGSLCYTAPQKLPLIAASVTVKACWAELSGEAVVVPVRHDRQQRADEGQGAHRRAGDDVHGHFDRLHKLGSPCERPPMCNLYRQRSGLQAIMDAAKAMLSQVGNLPPRNYGFYE